MGQISKALGMGSQFEWKGSTYKMSPWTYRVLGEFEVYFQEQALLNTKKFRPMLTDEEYRDLVHRTKKDVDAGVYTFGGEEVGRALQSTKYLKYLAWLSLRPNHPDITLEWVEEVFGEDPELLLGKMNEANADPKVKDPKTTT